ncbi:hypothetical protein CKO38_05400 [Rhodospirillum rubrum]|uniref:hypothetical protein n=1 Tax=Rhodospirillum rubrum TaxID=1085 RepID=UPI0019033221|nr:hypothetical protein [Rhodospirillum rubrum]MBK1664368.1 hypothetical protein [Rhodospirillum rubrum]MBK1676118.1 hypothetical protein [Rhodospirillum rubrum]
MTGGVAMARRLPRASRAPGAALVLAEGAPPLLVSAGGVRAIEAERGQGALAGAALAEAVIQALGCAFAGRLLVLVDAPDLRVETAEIPRVGPFDHRALRRAHLGAALPQAFWRAARVVRAPVRSLVMTGLGDRGGTLAALIAALRDHGLALRGPIAGALALPALGARLDPGPPGEHQGWALTLLLGRAGTRQIVTRDGAPVLARLGPAGLDGDALAEEARATLGYLRRRGYPGDAPCRLLLLGGDGATARAFRQAAAPLAAGAAILAPTDAEAALRLGAPAGCGAEALLAWASLESPFRHLWLLTPVQEKPGPALASNRLLLAACLVLAVATGAWMTFEARTLREFGLRRADLEGYLADLAVEKAALAREKESFPVPEAVLRAFAAQQALPAPVLWRGEGDDGEELRAALGPGTLVEALRFDGEGAAPGTLHLSLAASTAPSPRVLRARLGAAFPGRSVVVDGGIDDATALRGGGTATVRPLVVRLGPPGAR